MHKLYNHNSKNMGTLNKENGTQSLKKLCMVKRPSHEILHNVKS